MNSKQTYKIRKNKRKNKSNSKLFVLSRNQNYKKNIKLFGSGNETTIIEKLDMFESKLVSLNNDQNYCHYTPYSETTIKSISKINSKFKLDTPSKIDEQENTSKTEAQKESLKNETQKESLTKEKKDKSSKIDSDLELNSHMHPPSDFINDEDIPKYIYQLNLEENKEKDPISKLDTNIPTGISNKNGNFCFANAVIQMILNFGNDIPRKITQQIPKDKTSWKFKFHNILMRLSLSDEDIIKFSKDEMTKSLPEDFRDTKQHDSSDLLIKILNEFELEDFNFTLKTKVVINCKKNNRLLILQESSTTEKILTLNLPENISKLNEVTLREILDYNQKEQIESSDIPLQSLYESYISNKLFFETCFSLDQKKKLEHDINPFYDSDIRSYDENQQVFEEFRTIVSKDFVFEKNINYNKPSAFLILHFIRYHFSQDLQKGIIIDININVLMMFQWFNYIYTFNSAIIHKGKHSIDDGHYVTLIYSKKKYFLCDDSNVEELTEIKAKEQIKKASLICYERI